MQTKNKVEEPPSILVADDEPTNLDVLLTCLNAEGYRVLVAEDGKSAVERAKHALPDLILLDVLMPGMSGHEACRELKSHEPTRDSASYIFASSAIALLSDKSDIKPTSAASSLGE